MDIKGVGEAVLQKLNQLNIYNVRDLIEFLPCDYMDISSVGNYDSIIDGEPILLKVNIADIVTGGYKYSAHSYVKAIAECEGHEVTLIWFNAPYLAKTLVEGECIVYGVIRYDRDEYTMVNPKVERISNLNKIKGIKPIYPLKGIISNSIFAKIVIEALKSYHTECFISGVFDLDKAYSDIHCPDSFESINNARETLCLYELVKDLLAYRLVREQKGNNSYIKYKYPLNVEISLPYELTKSQKSAVYDIYNDMKSDKCMNRLVLGDVGSGKTFVALLAMSMVAESKAQSVMLAPTEILCGQHYDNAVKYLSKFGYRIAKLTSATDSYEAIDILSRLANGEIDMLFATHSCLSDRVEFANLKLAIIDEVHKFGVGQKAKLLNKGDSVGILSLSATPIPRSLAMNIYGDLDISYLEKRTEMTDNVCTYIFGSDKFEGMCGYIAKSVNNGDKCFVVCPRLKPNGDKDIYSCKYMYKYLAENYIPKGKIAVVYGTMSAGEKAEIMTKFQSGEVQVLVATTVVEVGVDVPDANKIFIIGADCFGLATLHQLRGRVGRDGRPAECCLHVRARSVPKRVSAMKQCVDGIKLARIDAEERGYGDIIGMRQSGKNDYARFNTKVTLDLVLRAKAIADIVDLSKVHIDVIGNDIIKAENIILN